MTPEAKPAGTGCPGVRSTISGRAWPICTGCALWGQPGHQLQPMAKRGADGVVRCPNDAREPEA